jgi:hypothetical protein
MLDLDDTAPARRNLIVFHSDAACSVGLVLEAPR